MEHPDEEPKLFSQTVDITYVSDNVSEIGCRATLSKGGWFTLYLSANKIQVATYIFPVGLFAVVMALKHSFEFELPCGLQIRRVDADTILLQTAPLPTFGGNYICLSLGKMAETLTNIFISANRPTFLEDFNKVAIAHARKEYPDTPTKEGL